ncbi:MAG: hypothetical protein N4J56_005265 [Chroococcidiopsis sp. SAG 2025]|nr:hypothetical protein [Chroococcidiopsis sp. SAG 2025]
MTLQGLSLVIGHWSLVIGYWSLVVDRESFVSSESLLTYNLLRSLVVGELGKSER